MTTQTVKTARTNWATFDTIRDAARRVGCEAHTGSMGGHVQTDAVIVGGIGLVRKALATLGVSIAKRRGLVSSLSDVDGASIGLLVYADDGRGCAQLYYALTRTPKCITA